MTANLSGQLYRLSYEAFAQFSSALTQTRNLEQMVDCLERRVKYLFDYQTLRVSFRYDDVWIHFKIGKRETQFEMTRSAILFDFEKELREKPIPKTWEVKNTCRVSTDLQANFEKDEKIWAWHFKSNELKDITITLVTGQNQNFNGKSIPFLRLFVEIMEGKLLELVLFEKVRLKNKHIENTLEVIEEKNVEIQAIMEHQDEVIKKQTADLKERNNQLIKISVLNAHSVREPLSRIMGLTNLLEQPNTAVDNSEVVDMIKQSSLDLDSALQEVITMAVNDVSKYKN